MEVGAAMGMAMEPAETVTRVVMYFVVVGAAGDGDEEADEDPDEEGEEAWVVVGEAEAVDGPYCWTR